MTPSDAKIQEGGDADELSPTTAQLVTHSLTHNLAH